MRSNKMPMRRFALWIRAGVPYLLAIGNHDYDDANPKQPAVSLALTSGLAPTRYAGKSFYQASFSSGSNENFYGFLTIEGKPYLFLMLEYRPRSAVLDWAESILQANPDKEAVIVTHSYVMTNGKREDLCDTQDMPAGNANGQADVGTFSHAC